MENKLLLENKPVVYKKDVFDVDSTAKNFEKIIKKYDSKGKLVDIFQDKFDPDGYTRVFFVYSYDGKDGKLYDELNKLYHKNEIEEFDDYTGEIKIQVNVDNYYKFSKRVPSA